MGSDQNLLVNAQMILIIISKCSDQAGIFSGYKLPIIPNEGLGNMNAEKGAAFQNARWNSLMVPCEKKDRTREIMLIRVPNK